MRGETLFAFAGADLEEGEGDCQVGARENWQKPVGI